MCFMKSPKMPTPPPPPAPPAAVPQISAKEVDFEAIDTDSAAMKKKRDGKKQFRVDRKQNTLGTNLSEGTGLSIPKKQTNTN